MKKKFFKVLALIFFVPVLLTGCLTLVRSSYKEFTPMETELSVWGFYGFLDNGRKSILTEFETLRGTSRKGYDELYEYLDNQKPLFDVLRLGMTAVDLKNQTSSQTKAYFEFDDMKNYTVERIDNTDRYNINYQKAISYNNFPGRDFIVDSILERLNFNFNIEAVVSTASSSREQSNLTFRTYAITPPTPQEIALAKTTFNKEISEGNKTTQYVLEESSGSNYFEIKASKIQTENEDETFRYEKSIKLTTGANIVVKLSYYDGIRLNTKEKTLPVVNPIKGFSINYKPSEGYLGWDLTYSHNGDMDYKGESYFQGNQKFILKEVFDVPSSKVMNFEFSLINEIKLDGKDFAFKVLRGNRFESLKTQNILKVGLYNGEPQAYLFSKDRTLQVATFQKYG